MMITGYSAAAELGQQQKLNQQINQLQSEISSGKSISEASDNPVAAARVSQIRQAQADQVAWTQNVTTAQSVAAQVDTTLQGVANVFTQVKELTLQAASQTTSASDRQTIVQSLTSLNETLASYTTAATPTGQLLFPTSSALLVPVSATSQLPATPQQSDVFDGVPLSAGGTGTLSSVIQNAITALSTSDPTTRATLTTASLSDIDAATTHVVTQQSAQGLRETKLVAAANDLTSSGEQLAEERSSLEDTDVANTVMQLNAKTLSLQAAQAAFARINKNTLFDFLS